MLFIILAGWMLAPSSLAADFLRQSSGSWFYGPMTVWTPASTSGANALFFPMSEPTSTANFQLVRFAYQMVNDQGDCRLRPAVRFSDNGSSWGVAKEVDATYVLNYTPRYGSTFIDITQLENAPAGAWIQFGVQTLNRNGSTTSLCTAVVRVEAVRK